MKREDDELRRILIELEASEDWRVAYLPVLSPSKDENKFGYHVQLLCDAGFMTQISKSMFRMTSQGHDYLDAIRSDTNWNRTKEGAAAVGGMTLNMMKDLAVAYLKQEAAEKLGVSF